MSPAEEELAKKGEIYDFTLYPILPGMMLLLLLTPFYFR